MTTASTKDAFDPMPCFACGKGTLARRDMQGHQVRYRDLAKVTIAESLVVPGCDRCGEMMLDGPQTRRLGEILQVAHAAERGQQMRDAVEQFMAERHTTQGIAERLLGLSQGYLSKLLHGERIPDVQTFRSVRGLPTLSDVAITRIAIDEDLAHLLPRLLWATTAPTTPVAPKVTPAKTTTPALVTTTAEGDPRKPKFPRRKPGVARRSHSEDSSMWGDETNTLRHRDRGTPLRHVAEKFGSWYTATAKDIVIGGARPRGKGKGQKFAGMKKADAKLSKTSSVKPAKPH